MTLAQVAEREALYRLIDQLPDRQTPLVLDFVRRLLDVDDEPLTPDELRQLGTSNAQIDANEFCTLEEAERRLMALP